MEFSKESFDRSLCRSSEEIRVMMSPQFRVYVSKFATTEGVLEARVVPCAIGVVRVVEPAAHRGQLLVNEGVDWHRNLFNAETDARRRISHRMRTAKTEVDALSHLMECC